MSVKTHRITEVPEERKIISSLLKLTINVFTQKVHKNNERGANTDVSLRITVEDVCAFIQHACM